MTEYRDNDPTRPINPYADDMTPEGFAKGVAWSKVHYPEAYLPEANLNDPLEMMELAAAARLAGWERKVSAETGAVTMLPMTARDESAWERSAIKMAANQVTLDVEERPTENTFARRTRKVAELIDPLFEAPPVAYHLTPESRIARGVGTSQDRENVKPVDPHEDRSQPHPSKVRRGD